MNIVLLIPLVVCSNPVQDVDRESNWPNDGLGCFSVVRDDRQVVGLRPVRGLKLAYVDFMFVKATMDGNFLLEN